MSAVRQPAETEHSGRLLLRMPRALHGELSLNRLIVSRLSGSPPAAPAQPSRSRFLSYALVVNFAVLLVTGATAVVLLVAAYK